MFNSLTNMGLSHYVSRREGNVASQSHPIMVDPHVADGRNRRDGRSAQGCTRAADEALSASKPTTLHLLPCYLRELFTRFIHPVSTHRTRTPRGVHRDATTSTSSSSPAGQGRFYLVSLTPYHAAACLCLSLGPIPLSSACVCQSARRRSSAPTCGVEVAILSIRAHLRSQPAASDWPVPFSSSLSVLRLKGRPSGGRSLNPKLLWACTLHT